jgi:thymidylate synthase
MGRNDVEYISKYAKFWETIQNEDGTVNSAYGNLIFNKKNEYGFTQYEWALESLLKDKDSRQAVLHFNLPSHQWNGNRDFVCTMYAIFQIRNGRLNFTVSMRSNDVILGLPTDVAFFVTLQSQLLNHLRNNPTYSELEMGTYTHIANSSHIYERHFEMANKMIKRAFKPLEIPAVNLPLILENGDPSPDLIDLFNDSSTQVEDSLYKWIQTNLLS